MIKNIQYLRFVAALLVVLAHADLQLFGISAAITNIGGFGVDIFFVISGFIIPYILFGGYYKQGSTPKMGAALFFWRRVTRIMPMYVIATAIAVFVSYLVATGNIDNLTPELTYVFSPSRVDVSWFMESMTFSNFNRPPILGVGWSLQIEFVFYMAVAISLLLGVKRFEFFELSLLSLFFILIILASINFTNLEYAKGYARPLLVEFMLGVLLYRFVSSGALMSKAASVAVIVLFTPVFLFIELNDIIRIEIPELDRAIAWGFPAFLLVWAAISLEGSIKQHKLIGLLGDSSYSLYLAHAIVAPLYTFYIVQYGLHKVMGPIIYTITLLVICHISGVVAHLLMEKPINQAIRNLAFKKKAIAATH